MIAWLIENWRDAILALVGLLAVYVVFSVMRLVQLSRAPARLDIAWPQSEPHLPKVMADQAPEPAEPTWTPAVTAAPEAISAIAAAPPAVAAEPAPASGMAARLARFTRRGQAEALAPAAPNEDFASELRQSHLDVEIAQLRRESERLREELAAMHEEMAQLKAARNVSPLYSEAASLAQKGVSADGIAGQCGISLGEAELVAALALADGRGGRVEPTEYYDPTDNSSGRANGGQPHRNRRTGTHG